ncbi:uncharacterized protein MELLADRAFT_88455 [Melampsora larici-populina 98AG31]|uniref:Piwi domain-containing protein n=1 Tax=Melampsora larici-populina (strain 98AG31 / pathotype 3-4-7) TaxID=747676 RepID=F4RRS8_MELLP|nr:uncharacterized protein MELLADRAFT_88455 [Melampsora larici-populina 98AG31]EGG04902.1 hypothetical protein MELLADRAFT_88455 [Melampsora larici-populina 98AG31]
MSVDVPMSRPGFGSVALAAHTSVFCNVFRAEISPDFPTQSIFQYSVLLANFLEVHITDFKDWSPPVVLRKQVFKKIAGILNAKSPPIYAVFDGDKLAFSHAEIPKNLLTGEVNASKPNERDNVFRYNLTPIQANPIKKAELRPLLAGAQHPGFSTKPTEEKLLLLIKAKQIYQAHNIAIKYPINSDENQSFSTSRAVFPFGAPELYISGGAVLKRGFIANLRVGNNDDAFNNILFSVDTTCATFVVPGSLVELSASILECHPRDLSNLRDDKKMILRRVLRKIKISIKRSPNDPGIIRLIYDFGSSSADERFQTEEGEHTVQSFFEKHHGMQLRGPHFPTVQTSAKKKANQQYKLTLQSDQQQRALTFQTSKPHQRFMDIKKGYRSMMTEEARDLSDAYGLRISEEFLRAPCRVLQPTHLKYGERGSAMAKDGQWNIARPPLKLFQPGELSSWGVMVCTPRVNDRELDHFFPALVRKQNDIGLNCPEKKPPFVRLQGTSSNHIRAAFHQTGKQARHIFGSDPQIIICVTDDKSQYYHIIKHEGDQLADKGVTTQCMVAKHLQKAQDQYLTNLALKVNIKIGGTNHVVPALRVLTKGPAMLVGVDLSHQNLGSVLKPSVVGMVGTMDSNLCRYSGIVGIQPLLEPANEQSRPRSQEPIEKFEDMLYQLLKRWKTEFPTHIFPKKLIIFRDGVSEGEFGQVLLQEYVGAKAALKRIGDENNDCKLSDIYLDFESHRIRFLAQQHDQDRSGNARAGTVVDQEIGDPHIFDFFCQSQAGLLGTSKPCRYCVLKDESDFSVDELQELVNSVCSSYQPATRSVGMAAPAYYADILADRGRMWLNIDDDQSSVGGNSHHEQTEEHRAADLEAYNDKINHMMNKINRVNHTMWWT